MSYQVDPSWYPRHFPRGVSVAQGGYPDDWVGCKYCTRQATAWVWPAKLAEWVPVCAWHTGKF